MSDVLLSQAVDQMRTALRARHYSDALAVGQHILHFYPKHIETYTVLAQVCLASDDLASATDLLRRVLSADPENVIALAGMAYVNETQEKYDEALWYLERAHEIQPSNDELRAELLRLREMYYGGVPTRIELSSGALARVYARQGQYAQAINEFRRLLRNDSKRFDARIALAETLYRAGRTDEAAHVAQDVMADAPYALKANLILGALWTENAVPEGKEFLRRAHQLDPEHRIARDLLGEQFDGTAQPRLPAFGERPAPTLPAVTDVQVADEFSTETQAERAAARWTELERAQEGELFQEPLPTDEDALERLERGELLESEPVVETTVAPAPAFDIAELLETASAPPSEIAALPQETVVPAQELDATLQEIAAAEQEHVEPEPPAPEPEPTLPPTPITRAERPERERLNTDAIAAAAAALASSIALDKANQPSPARRAHPALPKVRPVIRGAQDKLPNWLRISAPPSNAPASFDAPPPSTDDQVAPLVTFEADRPTWLIEAEAASVQETHAPTLDADLPEWLKPTATEIAKPQPAEIEKPQPAADVPVWLRDATPTETAPTVETSRAQETIAALPEWLEAESAPAQTVASETEHTPPTTEGWTNVPAEAEKPVWEQAIEQEPPVVRAETESSTPRAEIAEPVETAPSVEERPRAQAMPDSATMLQMARDKRATGDLKGALDLYERVMHRRPNHLEQVTSDLQSIIGEGDAPSSAHRLLGEAFAMAGRFKESLEQYRIAMGK